jgi:hypothetical protein
MNLEQQVCGEALALRLRDFGVKQESLYEYYLWPVQDNGDAPTTLGERSKTNQIAANDHAAAFTVAELLAELRKSCIDIELSTNEIEGWTVLVLPKFGDWTREHGEAPANALAKVLILLRDMDIGEMRTGGAA